MTLLDQLKENKGTVSSALGKQLAVEVLEGNEDLLREAIKLIHFDSKNVRSGAAKIIEKVAEESPGLVAGQLGELTSALDYSEPQTRWMMIHTFGLCAQLQPQLARDVFETVIKYLDPTCGTVLRDRAITYLGYMGAVSKADCDRCFPRLIEAFSQHPDRITRVFESFEKMIHLLDKSQKNTLLEYVTQYESDKKAGIRTWAKKVKRKLIA